jgi:hypothetical protein
MSEETRAMELELYAALVTDDELLAEESTRTSATLQHLPLTRELTLELIAHGSV